MTPTRSPNPDVVERPNVGRIRWALILSWHRPLIIFAGLMVIAGVGSAVGLVVDDRVLVGVRIWVKPLKFCISFVLYAVTLAWLISKLRRFQRLAWWSATVITLASVIEMAVIIGQVFRGRQSHFNVTTPLDSTLYEIMGATIAVLWITNLLVAVLLLRYSTGDGAVRWAVGCGIAIAVVGMSVGFLMLIPTAAQQSIVSAGGTTLAGAHSVGVADGGPGLPFFGWSTVGGDLRVGHFIGMHALQIIPLLGIVLSTAFGRRVDTRTQIRFVQVASAGYLGLVLLVTWQAERGEPLLSPSGPIAVLAAALVLATAAAATVIWRRRGTSGTVESTAVTAGSR